MAINVNVPGKTPSITQGNLPTDILEKSKNLPLAGFMPTIAEDTFTKQQDVAKVMSADLQDPGITEQPEQGSAEPSAQIEIPDQITKPAPGESISIEAQQRERERVKSIPETQGVVTFDGLDAVINGTDSAMVGPMMRAKNLQGINVGGTAFGRLERETLTDTNSWEATFTARRRANEAKKTGKDPMDVELTTKFPLLRNSTIEMSNKAILYHPEVLDAGLIDDQGLVQLDNDLLTTMGLVTEQFYIQGMYTTDNKSAEAMDETELADGNVAKQIKYSKAQGRAQLGREVFKQYKRLQADKRGLPTDTYAANMQSIPNHVFVQIGDLAKEAYYKANSDMLTRSLENGQVTFTLTPKGSGIFENLYHMYSGLFGRQEVPPGVAPSEDGQMVFEGQTYTRKVTTQIGDLGDTTKVFEAMSNMNKVAFVNDPRREATSVMLFMLALANAGRPEKVQDNQEPMYRSNPATDDYANMFKIGKEKYQNLVSEKAKLFNAAERAEQQGKVNKAASLRAQAEAYDPINILNLERENAIGIVEGMLRYSGKANYLNFAMQALTGRMHAQQTVYNPQAKKIIRSVVGSGNVYQWIPGQGKLDTTFIEAMSAHLFENPKLSGMDVNFKKKYGIARTPEERIRVFKQEELNAETNPANSLYMKYVGMGEELIKLTRNYKTKNAQGLLTRFKNATSPGEVRGIKQAIGQQFGGDPMTQGLKAYLAKYEDEAVLQADYLMALADYHRVKQANLKNPSSPQTFKSSITLEMDGKTHGPSTMAVLLGSTNMAKRSGIIMDQNFEKMVESGEYADLRDAMADTMRKKFNAITQGVTYINHENQDVYRDILDAAINDRENFLKKSPMTMGYGQEIGSLVGHVDNAVFMSSDIQDMIRDHNLNTNEVVEFLHTILVDSIFETMDPETLAAARLIKANAFMSAISGSLMKIKQPTGILSTIAGTDSLQDAATQYELDGKPVTVQQYKTLTNPGASRRLFGETEIAGAFTTGRLLPALTQGFDANMITRTFTDSWSAIQQAAKSNGASNTFVLPIFDAFLTDLGTIDIVRKEANKHHKESLIKEDFLEKVTGYYNNKFKSDLNKIPDNEIFDTTEDASKFKVISELFEVSETNRSATGTSKGIAQMLRALGFGKYNWNRQETLAEWNDRISRESFIDSKIIEAKLDKMLNKKISTNLDKLTGKEIKTIIKEIDSALQIAARNKGAEKIIGDRRSAVRSIVDSDMKTVNVDHNT